MNKNTTSLNDNKNYIYLLQQIDKAIAITKHNLNKSNNRHYIFINGKIKHKINENDLLRFRKKVITGKVGIWQDD